MLQTMGTSNATGCNPAEKKKIEDICECLDTLQCEIDENAANIQQNTSDISELDDRVTSVENGNFTNVSISGLVSTDVINPKTKTCVDVCANINTKNITAENITACSISDSDGRTLQTVSDCATQAATLANQLDTRVNTIECDVNDLDTDLQSYKNDLAACVSTSCVDAQSINVSDTVNAGTVCSNNVISNEVNSTVVNTKTISASGELVLPSPMATPNDWYTITVPANWNIKLSGKYTTENNIDYTFSIEVAEGLVRWSSFNYDVFKDFSFDKTTKWLKLRLKASENIKYVATHYDGDVTDISIERSGNGYTSYVHIPEQNDGIVAYGWDDQETRYCFPGTFRAKYMEQDSVDVLEDLTVRHDIYTTSEWDATGNTCCAAKGTDNQYLSYCDTGCECPSKPGENYTYPMWKTPVSCADNGKLEQSECLITEKAVSEYNGTVCDKITDPENPTDIYPITNLGDTTCVHGSIEVECNANVHCDIINTTDHCVCVGDKLIAKCGIISDSDVHISGDLYVDGTSHIVQTETVATKDNTVVLRQNASGGISSGEVSGLVINKYNGTDSLSLVTDCSGTLRVGTGTGVETCYPTICYNNTDGNWYINDVVTPITGNLTSYATKNEDAPYTIYTDAVFTVIDETTLEPLMTRDEASHMTNKGLVYWDATEVEGKTSCCFTIEDGGQQLVGGNSIVLDADQEAIVATNISGTNVCGDCVTVNCNLIQTDTNGCMFICGDLYVCGTTNIHGDVAGQVITQCNNNLDGFVSFVQCNHSNPSYSCVYTDECIKYNSASHILTVPTVCGNLCGTANCACYLLDAGNYTICTNFAGAPISNPTYLAGLNGHEIRVTETSNLCVKQANCANCIVDYKDSCAIRFSFAATPISNPTYLAGWNSHEIRAVETSNLCVNQANCACYLLDAGNADCTICANFAAAPISNPTYLAGLNGREIRAACVACLCVKHADCSHRTFYWKDAACLTSVALPGTAQRVIYLCNKCGWPIIVTPYASCMCHLECFLGIALGVHGTILPGNGNVPLGTANCTYDTYACMMCCFQNIPGIPAW